MSKTKFSWAKYREQRMESLSFFGRNRFQDWVIVLGVVSVFVMFVLGYGITTYLMVTYNLNNDNTNHDALVGEEVKKEVMEIKKRIDKALTPSEDINATSSLRIDPSR